MIVSGFVFGQHDDGKDVSTDDEPRGGLHRKLKARALEIKQTLYAGSDLHRSTSTGPPPSPISPAHSPLKEHFTQDWPVPAVPRRQNTAAMSFSEIPFQQAMGKTRSLLDMGRPYLRHSWHRIDLVSIVSFWIAFLLALSGHETDEHRHIFIFQALSTLRITRLLLITSGTSTILHSLKRAGPLLFKVAFFAFFALYLLSIIGVKSFDGSFHRSCQLTDPATATVTIDLQQACGGFIDSTTLVPVGFLGLNGESVGKPKGYICPLGQTCSVIDQPDLGQGNFDNIFTSALQLVIFASANGWSPIMYALMDSDYYASALFPIASLVILNLWLVSLLIAILVNTFRAIRSEDGSAFGVHEEPPKSNAPVSHGTPRFERPVRYFGWLSIALISASLIVFAWEPTQMSASQHRALSEWRVFANAIDR